MEYFHPYHGGVERLFQELSGAIAKEKDVKVTVLTADYSGLLKDEAINGVQVIRIPCKSRYHFSFKAIQTAINLAQSANLIHTTTYNAALPAWIAAKVTSKPIILTVHEYWGKLWWQLPYLNVFSRLVFYLYEQFVLSLSYDEVVAVSKHTREEFLKRFPRKKVKVIYNGLALRHLKSKPANDSNDYLFVGRLGVSKGLHILIPALKIACDKLHIRVKLVVPKNPKKLFNTLLDQLQAPIAKGQITLFHGVDDEELMQIMNNTKAILIPSMSEGFGFIALEASMLDTPIIHSGKGALNEVCFGKVIEFKPYTVEGLIQALERSEAGDFDLIEPKKFALEDMTHAYLSIYQSVQSTSKRSNNTN